MILDSIYIIAKSENDIDNIGIDGKLYNGNSMVLELPYRWIPCPCGEKTSIYTLDNIPELSNTEVTKAEMTLRNVEYPATLNFLGIDGKVVEHDLTIQSTLDPWCPTYIMEYTIYLEAIAWSEAVPKLITTLIVLGAVKLLFGKKSGGKLR